MNNSSALGTSTTVPLILLTTHSRWSPLYHCSLPISLWGLPLLRVLFVQWQFHFLWCSVKKDAIYLPFLSVWSDSGPARSVKEFRNGKTYLFPWMWVRNCIPMSWQWIRSQFLRSVCRPKQFLLLHQLCDVATHLDIGCGILNLCPTNNES